MKHQKPASERVFYYERPSADVRGRPLASSGEEGYRSSLLAMQSTASSINLEHFLFASMRISRYWLFSLCRRPTRKLCVNRSLSPSSTKSVVHGSAWTPLVRQCVVFVQVMQSRCCLTEAAHPRRRPAARP